MRISRLRDSNESTRPKMETRDALARIMMLALWFGLVAGLAESAVLGIKRAMSDGIYAYFNPAIIWMIPMLYVLLYSALGIFLFIVWRRWPRLITVPTAAFAFALPGFFSLLMSLAWLHRYAVIVLGLGLALQIRRFVAGRPDKFLSLARATSVWLLAGVLTAVVVIHGGKVVSDNRVYASLPPARPDAPNVLLITLDTVRASNLSLYGYHRQTTPNLERLARQGARFDLAASTAPWTLPSHASMFTGRYRRELSTSWTAPLDGTTPTLAEALSARGYITAGFVANLSYCRRETGLDRGFAYFDDYPVSLGEMLISSTLVRRISHNHRVRRLFGYYDTIGRKTAEIINEDFLGWLSRQNGKPFFAFLNYFDAHEPYLPPSPFDAKFGQPSVRKNYRITHRLHDAERMDKERMGPEEVQAELDAYDGAIAYLDHTLGKLFDELEKRNLLDNTLVIITSDHGEQFGEHGRFGHGNSLALQSLRVPLVIRFPSRVPAGVTVSEAISLRDIPSTVADLLNLEGAPAFPGRSLARYWNGNGEQEGESSLPVLAELFSSGFTPEHEWKGAKVSLLAKGKQYIRNGDGSEELYDLERDPAALHDISRDKESGLALSAFRKIFEGYNRYQVRAHQLSRP